VTTTIETSWPLPQEDPSDALAELRSEAPVHHLPQLGCHIVVAHHEAVTALASPKWSSNPLGASSMLNRGMADSDLLSHSVLFTDPPEHERLRRSLTGFFSPRSVGALGPRIAAIADSAFSELWHAERVDVRRDIAQAIPLAVMCELLDVDASTAGVLRTETPRLTAVLDPLADAEALDQAVTAGTTLMFEVIPLVAGRLNSPGEDLISALLHEGSPVALESDEAVLMSLLLLTAGHETTASIIGSMVVRLNADPLLARLLRTTSELRDQAIEELFRLDSPVQLVSRICREQTELGGIHFDPGMQILISIPGANRDPGVFERPDEPVLEHRSTRHIAFGHGIHFCAGAALARAEARVVLDRILQLDPPIEHRALHCERGHSITFRRFDRLDLVRLPTGG
jgi:cytochrome P450